MSDDRSEALADYIATLREMLEKSEAENARLRKELEALRDDSYVDSDEVQPEDWPRGEETT